MRNHRWLFGMLGCLCIAGVGCGSPEEEEFEYGEADMRQVVVGAWAGVLSLQGAAQTTIDLTIDQAPPSAEPACDNRTFNHPLCISLSTMDLDATLTSADGMFMNSQLTGSFTVFGLKLDSGELELQGGGVTFVAHYAGTFTDGTVNGSQQGSFTLQKK